MIDELTIATNGPFGRSRFDPRNNDQTVASELSTVFGSFLDRFTSIAVTKSAAVSAPERPEETPRETVSRAPVRDDDTNALENDVDRTSDSDDDPDDTPRLQEFAADDDDSASIAPIGGRRASASSDRLKGAASDTPSTPMFVGETAAVIDEPIAPAHHVETKCADGVARNPVTRTTLVHDTPDPALRPQFVSRPTEGLLQSARGAFHPPAVTRFGEAALTAPSFGATTSIESQSVGLARVVGEPGTTRVTVMVANEASNLGPQPSLTLAAAMAHAGEIRSLNTDRNAGGRHAPSVPAAMLHPNGALAQVQGAGIQSAAPAQPAQTGQEAVSIAVISAVPVAGGPPAPTTETVEEPAISLASTPSLNRSAVPPGVRANASGIPARPDDSFVHQISVSITRAARADIDKIEIRLRPERLGRVEVNLEVTRDGRVVAAVTTDNRETLELLKASVRGLEKALQDAGLKADAGSLSFSLRGHDTDARSRGSSDLDPPPTKSADGNEGDAVTATEFGPRPLGGVTASGRIDIRA